MSNNLNGQDWGEKYGRLTRPWPFATVMDLKEAG